MKKNLILLILSVLSVTTSAQLKVDYAGNVTIGADSNRVHTIKGIPYFNDGIKVYIPKNTDFPLGIRILSPSNYSYTTNNVASIAAYTAKTNLNTFGIAGLYYPRTGHYQQSGIGVYGATTLSFVISYPGIYAGYFNGDVRVTGSLYGTLLTPSTNMSSNDNVVQIFDVNRESENEELLSERLQQIPVLQYYRSPDANKLSKEELEMYKEIIKEHLNNQEENEIKESTNIDAEIPTEKQQTLLSEIKYGLDVDQMKKTFPELTYEDEQGNVSINYIEMIPILVQAIKELQTEIKQLKNKSSNSNVKQLTLTTAIKTEDEVILSISQNTPNPFSESTSIEISVPTEIKNACIIIYDMSGKQIQKLNVNERGTSRITILGSGLTEGMYIYSLIADGKVVGTKKMILTK